MLEQLYFELSMAVRGLVAAPQVWLLLQVRGVFSAWLGLWIAVTGIGMMMRAASKFLSKLIVIISIVMLFLGMIGLHIVNTIMPDYGQDDPVVVSELSRRLMLMETLPESFSRKHRGTNSIFLSAPLSASGHRYVALNRLACLGPSPRELTARIGADLNAIFPIIASGQKGKEISAGNLFYLGVIPFVGRNPVFSSTLRGHHFALSTGPEHWLQGTANHGVVRDGSGDLWLFQVGVGPPNEEPFKYLLAYPLAKPMWQRMGENISRSFKGFCHVPVGTR